MGQMIQAISAASAHFMEACAIVIIVAGTVRAIILYFSHCVRSRNCLLEFHRTRLRLSHSLSLGLEFLIGADVLKTAVSPTWEDLGKLATIVAIRSAINFLLVWELKHTEAGRGGSQQMAREASGLE